jgi:3-oxoacyl-[acyl-carrier-protein] synthase II
MVMTGNGRKQVVITGMGAVTPLGNDVDTTWAGMMAGACGVRPITHFDTTDFPCKIAATVQDFDPGNYLSKRDARRMSPFLHFAVAAADQALTHSGLDLSQVDPHRVGVEVSTAIGGTNVVEEQRIILETQGVRRVTPTTIPALLVNMPGCFISIRHNLRGPVSAPVSACATGIYSIGEGMRRIIWGDADVMLVGGSESATTPLVVGAFGRLTALSGRNDTPERAITPFDIDRDGTVIGEGAAVLVLESLEHAQARGAAILAEVKGYGLSSDAYHISSPREDGSGMARAMTNALLDAGLSAADVDYVGAHGTGTQLNDATETLAIKQALGEAAYQVPISSIKA